MTDPRPRHPSRQLAASLADAADDLAGWITGHNPDRSGINGLLGWVTGRRHPGNSVEQLASWIIGPRRR